MTIEHIHLPIGLTAAGEPVWALRGAGIEFAVGDDDGEDPSFGDEPDDGDEDDEPDDDEGPAAKRRTASRSTRGRQDDDGETDWTPPDREAWERVTGALKKANSEASKRRRVGKTLERLGIDDLETWLMDRGLDPETGMPYGDDVVDPDDGSFDEPDPELQDDRRASRSSRERDREIARKVRGAEQRGRTAERDRLMAPLMETTARLALREAGFSGTKTQLDRMLRTIDPRDLELDADDDGYELLGMDEAVEQLREDFPQFFGGDEGDEDAKPRRRRTSSTTPTTRTRGAREVDGGNRGRQPAKPMRWEQQMVDRMFQRGR
jgi:hypothetical protein